MQQTQNLILCFLTFVLLRCSTVNAAVNAPLRATALNQAPAAFECGKPGAFCGKAVPAGANCKGGPGFCQAGHYCGYDVDRTKKDGRSDFPKCLTIPKNCGTAGNECCPTNKDSPHQSIDDKLQRQPTCTDGSYCFYWPLIGGRSSEAYHDPYSAITGGIPCRHVPKSCGTEGNPCCPIPSAQSMDTSPQLPRTGCVDPLFCNLDNKEPMIALFSGTCMRNTPDCGQLGKKCCISTAGGSQVQECGGPPVRRPGQADRHKGYCANPPAFNEVDSSGRIKPAPFSELVCTPCPAKTDKIFASGKTGWQIQRENPGLFVCGLDD